MPAIPRERTLDSSPAFLREGYEFVSNRCRRMRTDAFETRLLLRRAICMQGPAAARFFYTTPMTRRGALPRPVLGLVQDVGSVATLDGAAHRRRKEMFLAMMTPEALGRLDTLAADEWRLAAERWRRADHVVLLPAVEELLCRTACAWAGVPLGEPEAQRRTAQLSAMVDGAGSLGPRNLRGHVRRRPAERWAAGVVRAIRSGRLEVGADAPAAVIARHTDADGAALDDTVAAVELLNVVRPVVATARFVAFAVMALDDHPELREELRGGDRLVEPFVHEVRRYYPFFPAIAGRTCAESHWGDTAIPAGSWILLDLYGTNRHPDAWESPDEFRPERFADWPGDPFTFVPQGGGDHATGHRCPGEWMTVALVARAVRVLTRELGYSLPPQDLRLRRSHLPPRPESHVVIRQVAPV